MERDNLSFRRSVDAAQNTRLAASWITLGVVPYKRLPNRLRACEHPWWLPLNIWDRGIKDVVQHGGQSPFDNLRRVVFEIEASEPLDA